LTQLDGLVCNQDMALGSLKWTPISKELELFSPVPLPGYHVPTYPYLIALDYTQTKIVLFNTVTHNLIDLVRMPRPDDLISSLSIDSH